MTDPRSPDDPERNPPGKPELPEAWKHPSEPQRESGANHSAFKGLAIVLGVLAAGVLLLFGLCAIALN
jgi:hypothetical protein